jgi:hypothetical protein
MLAGETNPERQSVLLYKLAIAHSPYERKLAAMPSMPMTEIIWPSHISAPFPAHPRWVYAPTYAQGLLTLFEPPRARIGIAAYAESQGRGKGRHGKTQIRKPDAYVAADGLDIV